MIYLLEDDESIRKLVTYTLQHAGYEAAGFERPSAFWAAMKRETPELVLLDIMLPEEDGLSVLGKLRGSALWRELPVVMLTAKNAEYDRVVGLDAGADDYISKPFSIREVTLRVKAVLRRSGQSLPAAPNNIERYKGICVDIDRKTVSIDGIDVPFTRTEFEILLLFIRKKGKVVSRAEMIQKVWPDDVLVMDRTVDVNITRVRKKISPYSSSIVTRSGFGYYLENE